jgi:hypothetical protein
LEASIVERLAPDRLTMRTMATKTKASANAPRKPSSKVGKATVASTRTAGRPTAGAPAKPHASKPTVAAKSAKSAKPAKPAKPAKSAKPAKPTTPAKPAKPAKPLVIEAHPDRVTTDGANGASVRSRSLTEALGYVTCPSGKLAIFDIGLVGFLPRHALEPMIVTCDVPTDRALPLTGTRVAAGEFADCWDHLTIELAPGPSHNATKLGDAAVDFARLVCVDKAALSSWHHDESLDGKADVIFWGRDDAQLAKALKAPRTSEGYGWSDLTIDNAESKVFEAEILKAEFNWMLNVDYRPHSHHFLALAAARAHPAGAGQLELAKTQMMLVFTTWGDGVFPVYLERDADHQPVRIRIQLATAATA